MNINAEKISIIINDFQNNYNNTHENEVYVKTTKSWKNILRQKIIDEFKSLAEIYCNKNAFKFLADLLISNFKDAYFSTYHFVIDGKSAKTKDINELIENKISSQFEDIYEKIKKHQEKVKEQEEKRRREQEEKRRREEEEKRKKEEEERRKKEEEELLKKKEGNGAYNPDAFF